MNPDAIGAIASTIARETAEIKPDLLAGVPNRGIIIGTAVTLKTNIPLIYVREPKGYGLNKEIEGVFSPGQRAMMIYSVSPQVRSVDAWQTLLDAGLDVIGGFYFSEKFGVGYWINEP